MVAHDRGGIPLADRPVFLYAAAYTSADDARLDYEALLELHAAGVVGTYDAAVIEKDADGKVHVHKREKPTQHGAWTGVGVGAAGRDPVPARDHRQRPSSAAAAGGADRPLPQGHVARRTLKELGDAARERRRRR